MFFVGKTMTNCGEWNIIAIKKVVVMIKFEFSRTLKQGYSGFLETVFLIRRFTLSFSEKNHEN